MEINWLAIFLAAVAGVVIGAVWFGPKTFFPVWWKLLGKNPTENPGNESMGLVFGLTFVGAFVQAIVMAVAVSLAETATGDLQWYQGLAFGALLGVGFSAATSIGHKLFGGFGLKVWILEVGQDILSLAAMGAIISAML
ncbi:MAG: hypothetical protein RIR24_349 [Actinomycetota bacterium]|jgi:hypothetical protein